MTLPKRHKNTTRSTGARFISIYSFANKVLNDKKEAAQWLRTPKIALGGEIPLKLLDTEAGAREVEDLLGRIEHSVYS